MSVGVCYNFWETTAHGNPREGFMFKIGARRNQPTIQATSSQAAGSGSYISAERGAHVRKRGSAMRTFGNLLIVAGVLMLVGIGGWLGYREWSNQQDRQRFTAAFGPDTFEPQDEVPPTPAPTPPPPLPVLASSADSISQYFSKLPTEQDTTAPVRLFIPSVNIDSKIVPVSWKMIPAPGGMQKSEWQVADYAVGHHAGSANPGLPG